MGNQNTKEKRVKVLVVGLDCAGKSTILSIYAGEEADIETVIPSIGYNFEMVRVHGFDFVAWDVGGSDKLRHTGRNYFPDVKGIVFVIDSHDRDRLMEARDELRKICGEELLLHPALLVFANKQDLPNRWSEVEMKEGLQLESLDRNWTLLPCCAVSGKGIKEGFAWLKENVGVDHEGGAVKGALEKCEY